MHFFPTLLPDELLYSVLARYHSYSGNESCKKTIRDLFGNYTTCAVTDLPANLESLSRNIPGMVVSTKTLLFNHTLLPYYGCFLPKNRFEKIKLNMLSKFGNAVHMLTGLTASTVKNPAFLKYCPLCVYSDREQFGVAYWHRSHQLPGVIDCYKHLVALLISTIPYSSRKNKHEYIPLDLVAQEINTIVETECQNEIFIARESHLLLINISNITLKKIKTRYSCKLQELNYLSPKGRIKFRELIPKFNEFYGEKFLNQIGSYIFPNKQDTWIHKALRNSEEMVHPLRHILLHGFLGLNLKNSNDIDDVNFSLPFGKGPWYCLNKAACHYKQKVVSECVITRCTDTGKPVGTFKCQCGFVYSRRGPDLIESDQLRIGRIKNFGEVWKEKLLQLYGKDKLSLRKMAGELGVSPNTVKRQYKIITLQENSKSKKKKHEPERSIEMRNSWLHMKDKPQSKDRKAVYSWLYKNDKEWLMKFKSTSTIPKENKRVEWEKRDIEIDEKIRQIYNELINEKKTRISKAEIGRRLGCLSLISNRLDKLPITNLELNRIVETTEEYQLRRVKLSVQELIKMNAPLIEWRIVKLAGLRQEAYKNLKSEIQMLINEKSN